MLSVILQSVQRFQVQSRWGAFVVHVGQIVLQTLSLPQKLELVRVAGGGTSCYDRGTGRALLWVKNFLK